jgi:hypothetical protein
MHSSAVAYAVDVGKQTNMEPCDVQILVQNIQNPRTASENESCIDNVEKNMRMKKKRIDHNRARPKRK